MSKYRIYELAKQYETTSKVIIDILARHNITAKNHMSCVDEDVKAIIDKTFSSRKNMDNQGAIATKQVAHEKNARFPVKNPKMHGENNNSKNMHNNNRSHQQNTQENEKLNQNVHHKNKGQYSQRSQQSQQNQRSSQNQQVRHHSAQNQARTSFNQHSQNNQNQQSKAVPANSNSNSQQQKTERQSSMNYSHQTKARHQQHNKTKHNNQPVKQQPIQNTVKPKLIQIDTTISVKDLAQKLGREVSEVIKKLMLLGVMANINQEVDFDTASLIAADFDVVVEALPPQADPTEFIEKEDPPETLVLRPPVVTVMGHVDHGKTSLLDCIRKTHVTSQEAGGITQHIGAYQVNYQGKKIVFLDTPGHEAFTAMRARGAQVTDVAILVVAADDGVMPQTIEAINHSRSANVPIIVAINKIDRPNANPDHVKQQLAEYNLIPEEWGGDTIMVEVSAHKKIGITDLLEMILLVAEMQELKANPNRDAQGTIVEAQLDKGRGPVATVLVQKGTLHIGDTIVAGTAFGKVRAMINDRGEKVKKAGPSTPVEVLGLSDVPQAGDILHATDEKTARLIVEKRLAKKRSELEQSQKVSLDDLFKQIQEGNLKELNILIKADVQGSVEALKQALLNIKNNEVKVSVIHSGVGAINESDIMLASASNALIIGFNVRPDNNARKAAETEKIDIRTYRIIYDAINDVEAAIKGMLAPTFKEVIQGRVEVRQIFTISKMVIPGCYVLEGKVTNSSQIRVIRDGIVIHEGKIESLRRFKDDVKEVAAGYECGLTLEKFRDIKEGDILEAFTMEEVKPTA